MTELKVQPEQGEALPNTEVVNIETLDQFVKALQVWNRNKVQLLKHMMDVPEGTEVTDDSDNSTVVLSGEARKGFILGLKVALSELGQLPFEAEVDFNSPDPVIDDAASKVH